MKIAVWLDEEVDAQVGGGFSYINKLVSLIDNYTFSKDIEIVFISRIPVKKKYKKQVVSLEPFSIIKQVTLKQKIEKFIINKIDFIKRIQQQTERNIRVKLENNHYIKQLKREGIHAIYYLTQTQCVIDDFPFITTNWDVGHISMFAFPEVINKNSFKKRDVWYQKTLKKALAIFVESEAGKTEMESYLNIYPERIKVLPIFPGSVIQQNVPKTEQEEILKNFNIRKNNYFFYPAQFWAHKNHYNLIVAFKKLLLQNSKVKLVFTGSDKGNLEYIKNELAFHGLIDNVFFLGFLNMESIYTLYKNALALVMPTFLGPTNMPLLEARALECPVICSDLKGHREQLEDGAIYCNPLESNSIYNAMLNLLDEDKRMSLLKISKSIGETSKFQESNAIMTLDQNLLEVSKYRNSWGNLD